MTVRLKEFDKKEMGARIRARREALKMSREDLGKRISVTGKFISDIECGDKGVSLKTLYKLRQVLGVSADFLMAGDPPDISDNEKKKLISENILGSLSVCSTEQLGCMEQIARLYVEGIVNKE
ncbi:MAG TPA: helix-turn-helix transcriptional regulator [Candidatus Copromorpha excrementigallinarum]|uniref:Helix-turn-helix transcriptional regulator n=1 Tax=Candidatus Allocopromorpha excrementigallinarum TaxID=2840742 RepID=A0A9D1I1Q9_9FIRM|nr:helix-turn-helix transcriptional regulator [Candidatus Copromorpha excrementigallinarum]